MGTRARGGGADPSLRGSFARDGRERLTEVVQDVHEVLPADGSADQVVPDAALGAPLAGHPGCEMAARRRLVVQSM